MSSVPTPRTSRFLLDLVAADGADSDPNLGLAHLLPRIRSGHIATFARGGTAGAATAIDANGVLYPVGTSTPRLSWPADPTTGLRVPGWLLEPARTNSVVQSQFASGVDVISHIHPNRAPSPDNHNQPSALFYLTASREGVSGFLESYL